MKKSLHNLQAVQIMRALAALLVVVGHAMYEAIPIDAGHRYDAILDRGFWMAGVDLFFILSGFIMMWTFGNRFGQPGAAQEFLIRRIIRIGPPYWIFTGLMLVAILLFADHVKTTTFTPSHLLFSVLFVPHLAPQGGLHPLLLHGWTLLYEMFFYLVFAAALLLQRREGLIAIAAAFICLKGVATHSSVLPEGLRLFLADPIIFEFLLGIGFFFLQRGGRLSIERLILIVLGCSFVGSAAYALGFWSENRFFHFGLPAFAGFAIGYYALSDVRARFWIGLILVGEASYALYLSHPFTLELVGWAFSRVSGDGPELIALYLLASVTLATLVAMIFWSAVEHPLNRHLSHWFLGARKPGATTVQ